MNDAASTPSSDDEPRPATADRYDELESILDDLRKRSPHVPQWEFCEGFLAALVCCRREIEPDEFLVPLLDSELDADESGASQRIGPFADLVQFDRFMTLWHEREDEVAAALEAEVETLGDEGSYEPQLFDLRGLVASLPPDQREGLDDIAALPSFAQLWAIGFMAVVDLWPKEWTPPRERHERRLVESALAAIGAMTGDDTAPPDVSPYGESDPPSVSRARFEQFGAALTAVYDLYDVFRNLGPRVEPLRKPETPGRNDPCWCGSGKKFKKCHGA